MPWGITKESTLGSLKNKSIEVRKLFAEVANKSLSEGKDEDEAIFAGLASVSALERKNSRELKKQQQEALSKANHVPEHIRLLQEAQELKKARQLQLEVQEEAELKEKVLKFVDSEKLHSISEMHFDNSGRLVIEYPDGSTVKTTNAVPEEVINKYISVAIPPIQKALEPVTVLNGSTPEIVFLSNGDIVMHEVILEE